MSDFAQGLLSGAADMLEASASKGLSGHIMVPGDKSISHRALILGAMASGRTHIEGLLEGQDVLHTAEAVRALGASVERLAPGVWRIDGAPWRSPEAPVDCGNSGTAARLLLGAAAGYPIEATFTGDASLRRRPMQRVLDPLRNMGADAGESDLLPVTIRGGGLRGISYRNDNASAQVKSALLFVGLHSEGEVEIIESAPSRDHSENMLRAFGCDVRTLVEQGGRRIRLGKRRVLKGTDILVPGDPSSAAFPLVAALIAPASEITVHGILMNPLRTGLFKTLLEMGADLSILNRRWMGGEEVADVTARASSLKGVEVPAERAPSMIDEYPILAVAAAFAEGETAMHGLAELRIKESDRLAAIIDGLRACGVEALEEGDTLRVKGCGGKPEGGASIASHGDHRIAMSFLVMGLGSKSGVGVDEARMIGTSFPGFAHLMRSIGAGIEDRD